MSILRDAFVGGSLACLVMMTGCAVNSANRPSPAQASDPTTGNGNKPSAKYLYAASNNSDGSASILTYTSASPSGTATPVSSTIPIANAVFVNLRADNAGHVYALSINEDDNVQTGQVPATVHVFAADTGVLTEIREFHFTTAGVCCGMAADSTGTVYVSDGGVGDGQNNLYVFAPTASGNATPLRAFDLGYENNFNLMTTDAEGNLYAKQANFGKVYKYAPGFTSAVPSAVLDVDGWDFDIAVDGQGHLFMLGYLPQGGGAYGVIEYPSMSAEAPSGYVQLLGQGGTVTYPGHMAADANGFLYIGDFSATKTSVSTFESFASGTGTQTKPVNSFAGSVPYCYHGYGEIAVQ